MNKKSSGETELSRILKTLRPRHNPGDYVFSLIEDWSKIDLSKVVMFFKEEEGNTVIMEKELADQLKLSYSYVAGWITLSVHSSLAAVGLTAAFSSALAENGISCNVVAACYHDHLFVEKNDVERAIHILTRLSG